MNFTEEIQDSQVGPKNHIQRVFFAISTAVCLFAFQNCSSVDFSRKATHNSAISSVPVPAEFQVDQASSTR